MKPSKIVWRAALCAGAMLWAQLASAAFPDRPIKLIVPYASAGITDNLARALADGLGRELKQPVVVENRAGAGAMIGTAAVARAPADGYTLLMSTNGNLVLGPLLYKKLNYDVKRELDVIGLVAEVPTVIVSSPQVPATDLRQFGAYAKANRDKVNYASLGQGNVLFLVSKMLETELDIQMTEVPYKGSSPALTAVLSNDVQLMVDVLPSSLPFIRAGKLNALAVPGNARLESLPNVPTIAEAGYPPFHAASWLGLSVPANTPANVVATLQAAIHKVTESPQFRQTFTTIGLVMLPPMSKPQIDSYLEADRKRWGDIIQRHNISLD